MINLFNKKKNYKTLIKLKKDRKHFRKWFSNLIYPDKFLFLAKIYEKFMLNIIQTFANVLIRTRNETQKIKRKKVVYQVYQNFISNEYNFTWLSIIFYILISFIPIIYLVSFLNITINDNIPTLIKHVEKFYLSKGFESIQKQQVFQYLFNSVVFNKFIPDGNMHLIIQNEVQDNSFKIYSLLPGSFIAIPSLYIASGGYGKLISAYNYIFSHNKIGSFWGNKIKGLSLVLLVAITLWFVSTINILIQASIYNNNSSVWLSDFVYIIFVGIFVFLLFVLLFKFTPSFKIKTKDTLKGAFISWFPTFILVILYTYLHKIVSYSKFGTTIGFFFAIGFFINWFVYFMFLGIIFNNAYYKNYISSRTQPKKVYSFL
ncbi:YhjD/YihY/BrkB family envelope integrity protein [Mycoplasma leonicaptivi]|uniref:YhjD/YihY/BrkB family envelope integrity protein n=1 Tax=Mycoplasma leonicaptivi TaxID=36742 RepID=UPI00048607E9|nr:YhjD/YihY/BrkB family envelope integrity protein [Mycoplasma leonicaptivi]